MKRKDVMLAIAVVAAIIVAILILNCLVSQACVHATRENGRYDVSCYLVPPEGCGVINFQDAGLIHLHSIEYLDEDYVYDVLYDMNCDYVVNATDVDLCWENID